MTIDRANKTKVTRIQLQRGDRKAGQSVTFTAYSNDPKRVAEIVARALDAAGIPHTDTGIRRASAAA